MHTLFIIIVVMIFALPAHTSKSTMYIDIPNHYLLTYHLLPVATEEIQPTTQLVVVDKAKNMDGKHGGQCVEFIQRLFNSFYTHPEFRGIAGNIQPNSENPKVGDAILLKEGPIGHVALIIEIEKDDIILTESNYSKYNDEIVNVGRRIQKDNERIVGYFTF